ncbi:hypothetical protein EMMF5_004177 [Cystobasidiomycetes sp. EMM_F5]
MSHTPSPSGGLTITASAANAASWVDLPALLNTYGYALQCLVNVGVRGSEQIRTRVVESGVLVIVARILTAFLAARQKERERRLMSVTSSKAVTLYETALSSATPTPLAHPLPLPLSQVLLQDAAMRIDASYSSNNRAPATSLNGLSVSAPPSRMPSPSSSAHAIHALVPSQPSTLPPSASRLPASSIQRTNTPDTVLSLDEESGADIDAMCSGTEDVASDIDATNDRLAVGLSDDVCEHRPGNTRVGSIRAGRAASSVSSSGNDEDDAMEDTDQELVAPSAGSSRASSRARRSSLGLSRVLPEAVNESSASLPSRSRQSSMNEDDGAGDGDVSMEMDDVQYSQTQTVEEPAALNTLADMTPVSITRDLTVTQHQHQLQHRQHFQPHQPVRPTIEHGHRIPRPLTATQQAGTISAPQNSPDTAAIERGAAASATIVSSASASSVYHGPPPSDHLFKDDDILHCLHLLAYLSKYPHVRAVFHDPENEEHRPVPPPLPASNASMADSCAHVPKRRRCGENGDPCPARASSSGSANPHLEGQHADDDDNDDDMHDDDDDDEANTSMMVNPATVAAVANAPVQTGAHRHRGHAHRRRSSREGSSSRASGSRRSTVVPAEGSDGMTRLSLPGTTPNASCDDDDDELAHAKAQAALPAKDRKPAAEPARPPRSTDNNVFSLVEQFTFRPSNSHERGMRLPTDIQYWAGVIMRNACRKDELRGGLRQCANMGCGVWERFPREFAKCRRCRKAKYCSKGCQKRAWQAGHRYWCSARQDNPPLPASASSQQPPNNGTLMGAGNPGQQAANGDGAITVQIDGNGTLVEGNNGIGGPLIPEIRIINGV